MEEEVREEEMVLPSDATIERLQREAEAGGGTDTNAEPE